MGKYFTESSLIKLQKTYSKEVIAKKLQFYCSVTNT